MELDIAFLANVVGESSHALHFTRASKARKNAMDVVFWNEEKGQWFDYWLNASSMSKVCGYVNVTPQQPKQQAESLTLNPT